MADPLVENIEHWAPNEVISATKLNKMVDAILYTIDTEGRYADSVSIYRQQVDKAKQDANGAIAQATNATNLANSAKATADLAKTTATTASTVANEAVKKIKDAIGGKGYASLTEDNVLNGSNTFNGSVVMGNLLQLDNGFRTTANGSIGGDLDVTGWINGKLRTIQSKSGVSTITTLANAIDSNDGVWNISNNISGLPNKVQQGTLLAKSDGSNSNSGVLILSDKSNPDRLYVSYVTNGNLANWTTVGNAKLATITRKESNLDLNTLTTTGMYDIEADHANNAPEGVSYSTVLVMQGSENNQPSTKYLTQLLITQNSGQTYTRSCWNGSWTDWSQLLTAEYLSSYNIQGNSQGSSNIPNREILYSQDLNQLRKDGHYVLSNTNNTNAPQDPDTKEMADGPFTCTVIANASMTIISQELVQIDKGYKYVRSYHNGNWTGWSVLTPYS